MKSQTRRSIAVILAVLMVFSTMMVGMVTANADETATATAAVYMQPNDWWPNDGATFAAYFYADGKDAVWTAMADADKDGIYEAEVPADYTNVIFVRMNPAVEMGWGAKWNQTDDLTIEAGKIYSIAESKWVAFPEPEAPQEQTTEAPQEQTTEPAAPEATYYVASDKLNGEEASWDVKGAAMTVKEDGSYEKVYTELAAGTYEFKVTQGDWAKPSYTADANGGNTVVNVEKAGSTLTITFNPADSKVNFAVVAPQEQTTEAPQEQTTETPQEQTTEAPQEQTTEAPQEQTTEAPQEQTTEPAAPVADGFYLTGSAYDWKAVAANKFELNGDSTTEYKLTITIAENDAIKPVKYEGNKDVQWYGNDNYIVKAEDAGKVNIYFQETYKADWAKFGGYFWIEKFVEEQTTEAPQEQTTEAPQEQTTEAPQEQTTEAPQEQTSEPAAPVADGFYLMGTANEWKAVEGFKFELNGESATEYKLTTTLKAGDEIKVAKVENGEATAWYGNFNYAVTDYYAGEVVSIYFQEAYRSDWEQFGGNMWISLPYYKVTYTYTYDGVTYTQVKYIESRADEIEAKIELNAPVAFETPTTKYTFDKAEKTGEYAYTAAYKAETKKFKVTFNGAEEEYEYMALATFTSDTETTFIVDGVAVATGKSFTTFVTGNMEIKTDAEKAVDKCVTRTYTGSYIGTDADGKTRITVEFLISAVGAEYKRIGVAFAKEGKSADDLKAAIAATTEGTSLEGDIAVHNSKVTAANVSGQYQFIYAPYITNDYSGLAYYYAFAVDAEDNIILGEYDYVVDYGQIRA